MDHQRGWHWKRRFSGLAFRISFMVFAATLSTSLVITWVSIHSIETFLRSELERDMALIGAAKLSDINEQMLRRVGDGWSA